MCACVRACCIEEGVCTHADLRAVITMHNKNTNVFCIKHF